IHSFWPPALAGKLDVVPGRVNHMEVNADKPGTYYGQCAEYCGTDHAVMRLRVVADSPTDFDQWVSGQQGPAVSAAGGDAANGATLFANKGCEGCHTV